MKLLIWCEKSKGGEEFLTEESWNGDGNGDMRGGTIRSSLFETLGFTNLFLKKNINVFSSYFYFSSIGYMVSFL
jgi:hypothetical protein